MKISQDVRAAAEWIDEDGSIVEATAEDLHALVARLRAHAALLDRIEREMREYSPRFTPHSVIGKDLEIWADALKTGSLE